MVSIVTREVPVTESPLAASAVTPAREVAPASGESAGKAVGQKAAGRQEAQQRERKGVQREPYAAEVARQGKNIERKVEKEKEEKQKKDQTRKKRLRAVMVVVFEMF